MAKPHRGLKGSYSVETSEGFARLSRMAGRDYRWPPPNSGNVNEDIMLDAVYGGAADPSAPREYAVYSIEWLEEHPEAAEEIEAAEAGSEAERKEAERTRDKEIDAAEQPRRGEAVEGTDEHTGSERVSGEPVEEFTRYLDETFSGWVYHQDRDEVYVMGEDSDEDRAQQKTRRRR